jgi:hypothetical protein
MATMNFSETGTGRGMDYQFSAEEWRRIAPAERVSRCRLFAHEASELALSADPTMKRAYLDIAQHWEKLATEIEAEVLRVASE